ncbi:DUF4214 domain-containing protein [Shinella sp. BYT-45]|uniref:DUF4214 domain-containing protein n=1 Tax=Shinella sp. BYT-45 TaxID=3377377 RepID=UPI003980AC5A
MTASGGFEAVHGYPSRDRAKAASRTFLHAFAAAAFLFLAAGSRPVSAEIVWGVNGHPINSYPGVSFAQQLDLVQDLGARSYRVDISRLASADKLAALVAEALPRGIKIVPVLTPDVDLKAMSEDELYERSHTLARTLGTRFRDEIRVWELGNELENFAIIQPCETRDDGTVYPCEWGPAGGVGALDYYGPRWAKVRAVLRGLSEGMTEADPTIRKAMGTAGWGHTGAFERMRADGIGWDISVWHMYGGDYEWAFKLLAQYDRPIWVTEFNHPFGSRDGAKAQAEGLVQQMERLRELEALYRIEEAHIYELLDETYWAPDFEAFMGLVELEGSAQDGWKIGARKPAYEAVRQAIRTPRTGPGPACDIAEIRKLPDDAFRKASLGYCLVLDRAADRSEAEGWVRSLQDGMSEADMLAGMLASDEFSQKHAVPGMSDGAYIDLLYRVLLGRPADGAGRDAYLAQLRAGTATRETIARAIVQSGEFADRYAGR